MFIEGAILKRVALFFARKCDKGCKTKNFVYLWGMNNTHTMNREDYIAAEQAAFTAAERAFDANPCQKTASKLSNARVNLERKKEEWRVSPAGRAANLSVLQVIAKTMRKISYDMDEFSNR